MLGASPRTSASCRSNRLHANCCVQRHRDEGDSGTGAAGDQPGAAGDGADSSALEDALYGGEEPDAMGESVSDGAGRDGDAACGAGGCEYESAGRGRDTASDRRAAAGPECKGEQSAGSVE